MFSADPSTPLDYSNSSPGIVISGSILGFFTTVVIVLRFWARRLTRQQFGLDDYLCLAALTFHHATMVASCVGAIQGGLGRDMRITATDNLHSVVILFQAIFVAEIGYTFSSPLIKLSVLALYWRLFPTPFMKLCCKMLASLCLAWFFAIFILDFTECIPLKAFWFLELQLLPTTRCLNPILAFLGNSIANSLIDFCTLILPIHEIMKLHTTTRRKISIGVVFLLGGIALAASLTRTVSIGAIYREGIANFTKQFVTPGIATVVEIYVAVVGACLPTLIPVYRQLRYGSPLATKMSTTASLMTPDASAAAGGRLSHRRQFNTSIGSFELLAENDDGFVMADQHKNHQVMITSRQRHNGPSDTNGEEYSMDGVVITRDTVWTESRQNNDAV